MPPELLPTGPVSGHHVLWRGTTYQGNVLADDPATTELRAPSPAGPEWQPTTNPALWTLRVPTSEVWAFELTTTCTWRSARFLVTRWLPDGLLELQHQKEDRHEADRLGLQGNPWDGWWAEGTPAEVSEVRQERTTLGGTPPD
ncbi:hypothetical protein [Klenkia marina]|uniref:hypothetical protein n=1 Tax=Klenkia marina TaxID=1960309 RepID=UPI000B105A17|nr:hypothetical protein [Klenkia marina]